jgi:hypothetical protein
MGGIFIPPNYVLEFLSLNYYIIVLRKAFVWALARSIALGEVFPFDLFLSTSLFAKPKHESDQWSGLTDVFGR